MSTHETESDVGQWVSSFFDVDHLYNSDSYGENKLHDLQIDHEQYAEHTNFDFNNVESNEYALQEEVRQLSILGTHELSCVAAYSPNTNVAQPQDWLLHEENYYAESGNVEVSTSCNSLGERSNNGEEYYNLGLTYETDLDGEVGERLNQMIYVPHIPRIIGDIPSTDEETSSQQKPSDRLLDVAMSRHETESDAGQWVSSFFNVDHLFNSDYYGETKLHDVKIDHEQYAADRNFDFGYKNVENNEYALQEELRQLSIAGTGDLSCAEEYFPNIDVAQSQDWPLPEENYYAEFTSIEAGQEELGNVEVSSSCSSLGGRSNNGEEYYLGLTDESDLDAEVGKRLNQMVSVPHIPRINGDIPSTNEETSDHHRLLDRLKSYNLIEQKVQGDGNCQFLALSDQLYRSPEHHKFVRKQIVNQLKSHPDMYEDYVPMAYGEYLKRISKSGEWGDHVTLQAAADSYGIKILIITSFKDTCYIEILPKIQKSKRVIYLSFWAEVHYNSIYPQGDLQLSDFKKKKKWWTFRKKQKEF